jgi:signal transduction histidine kinase
MNYNWIKLGHLYESDCDLEIYKNDIGIFKAIINSEVVYIGHTIEKENGGFSKILRNLIIENSDSKNSEVELLFFENKQDILIELLILNDKDIVEIEELKNRLINQLKPKWDKSEFFNWNFDVNVFKLLGSQLISDKFTAIIELVKNSYDANATEVKIDFFKNKITIKDNGLGMSKEDISSKWMKIGTNNKRNTTHSPEPFNRVFLGEKGIGRFAIEKIADLITLETKQEDINIIHKLVIDWSVYKNAADEKNSQLFTSMLNKYEQTKALELNTNLNMTDRGTILTFENLKEEWTSLDIRRLKRELAKFVSPIRTRIEEKNGFKIFVKEYIENTLFDVSDYEEVINSSLDYASESYHISFNQTEQEELHFNEEKNEIEILKTKIKEFGPINIHIFYFNSEDKKKFKLAYKGKDLKIDGFKIYRDSILATPFVEIAAPEAGVDSYRDILGIDKRRWSNFFGKISSHDFIGIIEITKKDNPDIKDLTNRQDFEDTKEYRLLKEFIVEQLIQIENKLIYDKKLLKEEQEKELEKAKNEVNDIREHLNSLIVKEPKLKEDVELMYSSLKSIENTLKISSKEIDELNQTIERKDELYHSLMSLQEYAADLAHMIRNSLDKILGISKYFVKYLINTEFYNKSKMLEDEVFKMKQDVEYMLNYAESGHKLKEFDLSDLVLKTFNRYSEMFEKENISVQLIKPEPFKVTHVETFIRDIFNNLISNSRRSLKKVNKDKKIIKCSAYKENDEFIILFSDNGIGIEDDIKEKIYDRYFSTNKDEGGSGIGLYVVKNNLKTLNGKIELINPEFQDGCTFKIIIPIKKVELND